MKERGRLEAIYMAKRSFRATIDGERVNVMEGDLVRAGHPLLAKYGDRFESAGKIRVDVEQATAAPGELR